MSNLNAALRALNDAAYAAIRAGSNTTLYPYLDRQTLREICTATDKLVDDNAPEPAAPDAEALAVRRSIYERDLNHAGRGHLLGDRA